MFQMMLMAMIRLQTIVAWAISDNLMGRCLLRVLVITSTPHLNLMGGGLTFLPLPAIVSVKEVKRCGSLKSSQLVIVL